MFDILINWGSQHWVEITGTVFGVIYIFLSVRQNILTWLLGLLSSILYIFVFFESGFYADMALQFYYVWISIYGWVIWAKGKQTDHGKEALPVTKTNKRLWFVLFLVSSALWVMIWFVLKQFTDSPVPVGDSFTTALSIVATWMLARKKIEHWMIWVIVDIVSLILYIYKGLYPTSILFAIYTIAAIWGYFVWRKDLEKHSNG